MSDTLEHSQDIFDQNVSRILDSAEKLFRVYGYTKTNVADIAKDLGMSPANVYRFFRSKADIHQALAERMLHAIRVMMEEIAARPDSASDRLRAFALTMHRNTVETMMDAEKVHEMVVVALENQWSVIEAHLERLTGIVATIVADGIRKGELPAQDPVLAAKCFTASMSSICHPQMVAQCPPRNNRATPEQLVEFAIRALKA